MFNDENKNQPVLLAVLAHPDDESFGMGGTLAYYAQNGVRTELVCATKGEVGEMDPKYLHDNLTSADVRVQELRCAAGILGISHIHFLDYRDSGMTGSADNQHPQALCNQSVDQVAAEVADIIRKVRPNVVVTFDPIGGYRHPDHIAIHQAAVKAYQLASDPSFKGSGLAPFQPDKLVYNTFPKTIMRLMIRMMKLFGKDPTKFGQNQDIDLASIAEVTFPIHYKINYRTVEKEREAASACHASQGGAGLSGGIMGFFRRVFTPYETYMQALPEYTEKSPEKDLFFGIS
jgi:N-acetyl-1-D-myo-inositol-2-amino-2-deoxy-alpha-D-glucopyranoside deacetylase